MLEWLEECIAYKYITGFLHDEKKYDAHLRAIMNSKLFGKASKKRINSIIENCKDTIKRPDLTRYYMIDFEDMFFEELLKHIDITEPYAVTYAVQTERTLLSNNLLFPNDMIPLLYNMWEDAEDYEN